MCDLERGARDYASACFPCFDVRVYEDRRGFVANMSCYIPDQDTGQDASLCLRVQNAETPCLVYLKIVAARSQNTVVTNTEGGGGAGSMGHLYLCSGILQRGEPPIVEVC